MSATAGKNALSNMLASLATPLIGLVMTPFYLKKIGLEGLGLVGLMALVSSVLGVFVVGASRTYQRDLSTAQLANPEDLRGLVGGGMSFFVILGTALGLIVALLGSSQITALSNNSRFTPEVLQHCLVIISIIMALGVTNGALGSTLAALRDQAWPSLLSIVVSLLVAIASWLTLSRWPQVDVYYACQLGGAILLTVGFGIRSHSTLRQNSGNSAQRSIRDAWGQRIKTSGRLSLTLIVHEGLGVLITQIDRFLIAGFFPLAGLGIYNLGASPSRLVTVFTAPVTTATYPELCRLASNQVSRSDIGEYLGRITFILVVLLGSAMIVLIPSAPALLELWLGKSLVPSDAASCLILLSLGQLLLAIAGPAYNLTVAFGRIGYGVAKNITALILLPIVGFISIKLWGLPGVASVWITYGITSIFVCNFFAYSRHSDLNAKWIRRMVTAILTSILIATVLTRIEAHENQIILFSIGASILYILSILSIYVGPNPRSWIESLELPKKA